jgi:preprotein translocase subunit SecY
MFTPQITTPRDITMFLYSDPRTIAEFRTALDTVSKPTTLDNIEVTSVQFTSMYTRTIVNYTLSFKNPSSNPKDYKTLNFGMERKFIPGIRAIEWADCILKRKWPTKNDEGKLNKNCTFLGC